MQITFFGILWIFLMIIAFFQTEIKKMVFITLFSMIFQSNNIIIINGAGIGPQIITSFVFIVKSFLVVPHFKIRFIFKDKVNIAFFVLLLVYIFSSLYKGTLSSNFFQLLMISIYIIAFYRFLVIRSKLSFDFIHSTVKFITYFIILVGFFQLLYNAHILPIKNILGLLIYNDNLNGSVIFHTKDLFRFYSTFMEPSFSGAVLVGLFYYFISKYNIMKKSPILLLLLISIVLTQSSTAYGALVIVFAIWIISSNLQFDRKIIFVGLGITLFIVLYMFTPLLENVIFNKFSTSSARVRSVWNSNAYELFKNNKLLGVGYKNSRASSLLLTIMAESGLIGMIIFLYIVTAFFIKSFACNGKAATLMVLSVFIAQIIAIPDFDFSGLWLVLYIYALTNKKDFRKEIYYEEKNSYTNIPQCT